MYALTTLACTSWYGRPVHHMPFNIIYFRWVGHASSMKLQLQASPMTFTLPHLTTLPVLPLSPWKPFHTAWPARFPLFVAWFRFSQHSGYPRWSIPIPSIDNDPFHVYARHPIPIPSIGNDSFHHWQWPIPIPSQMTHSNSLHWQWPIPSPCPRFWAAVPPNITISSPATFKQHLTMVVTIIKATLI